MTQHKETIDEFIARGGSITKCEPAEATTAGTVRRLPLRLRAADLKQEGARIQAAQHKVKRMHKKLTPADITQIRELVSQGASQADVAKRFGVHQTTICHHLKGRERPAKKVRAVKKTTTRRDVVPLDDVLRVLEAHVSKLTAELDRATRALNAYRA